MHWVTKRSEPPKRGDQRCRLVFAWKPTNVGRHTVWLEHYEVYERYFVLSGRDGWWSEESRNLRVVYP
jgi:hypothetical protein